MNVAIILVAPQMGENIGLIARAMKNFAFSDLRVILPRNGWPNDKAISASVGAVDVIRAATVYTNISDAISDLEYIYATTAVTRSVNKEFIYSSCISDELKNITTIYSKIGIMFGRESSGLSNTEIGYANKILVINNNKHFSSLNISHAVSIVCYELFNIINNKQNDITIEKDINVKDSPASSETIEYFYTNLFRQLTNNNFFHIPEKKHYMELKIRNIFSRIYGLTKTESQILIAIIKSLSNR